MEAVGKNITDVMNKLMETVRERNREETDYYKNGLSYCGKCHTPKEKLVTNNGISRICPVNCKCKEEYFAKKAAEEEIERKEQIARNKINRRKEGFSDSDMIQWTFEQDDNTNPQVTDAMRRYVENFERFKDMGYGLLLYGTVGTGKTFAAAEVVNALIDKGYTCLMTNFSRIVNTIWAVENKQAYLDDLNAYDLLVLDDMSAERDTAFMRDIIFQIIDARYRANLPLIVTTNLDVEKMDGTMMETRVYNRLQERCLFVRVEASNKRVRRGVDNAMVARKLLGIE